MLFKLKLRNYLYVLFDVNSMVKVMIIVCE